MRNYNDYLNENNDIDYLEKSVLDNIKMIIMEEEGISEKNFIYLNALYYSFNIFLSTLKEELEYTEDLKKFKDKRKKYIAEVFYDKYFKDNFKIKNIKNEH